VLAPQLHEAVDRTHSSTALASSREQFSLVASRAASRGLLLARLACSKRKLWSRQGASRDDPALDPGGWHCLMTAHVGDR
jgi:hypothetical protein